jgi:hypothetical protein
MKPHKHAEVIKAWADGAKIEYRNNNMKDWDDMPECSPLWYETVEYRIKPQEVIKIYNVSLQQGFTLVDTNNTLYHPYNLVLTFDEVSGHLRKAEVIS